MQPSVLLAKLAAAAGRRPTGAEQHLLRRSPNYEPALKGDKEAGARLLRDFVAAVALDHRPEARDGRAGAPAEPPTETRTTRSKAASVHERQRAAIIAQQLARDAAAENLIAFWREMVAPTATVRWLSMGKDAFGLWREVQISIPDGFPPFPTSRLRLRDEPLALEVRDDSPYARVERGSIIEPLLRQARALAVRGGWSEAEAFKFLMGGEAPKPAPLVVRVMAPRGKPEAATVTIMAGAHVSSASVAAAFAKATGREGGSRPVSARSLTVVAFVDQQTAANGGKRPPWPKLLAAWNRDNPRLRFKSYPDLCKSYTRALARKA